MKYLRSEHLAEEAVQDIFLKIWENREELVFVDDFSSWVFRLTKNYLLNILKRASTETRIKDEISRTISHSDLFDNDLLAEKETIDVLHNIIAELPTQRQEIFKLCRFEQKSYEEVALYMGISKSTVNDHMVKAMKYLKSNFPKNVREQ
jgi:RNA polymerase sigma-70 factor (ECF subfamily)